MRKLVAACSMFWITASLALAGPLDDARAKMDAQRWDEADALLERAVSNPALEARALQMLAEVANLQEDYAKGIEWGKKAIAAAGASSNAHYQYAVAIRNKMQQVNKVRAMMSLGAYKKELARAIELDGSNVDARQEQIGFYLNAPGVAGGSADKARELAVELREIEWRTGTIELAQVEASTQNTKAATVLYEELLERHPDDVGARLRLGYNLQLEERWQDADAQFAKLVDAEGNAGPNALYQRARTRILGKYDQEQAVAFLEQYVEQVEEGAQPSPSAALWRMGNAYEQLGRNGDARAAYQQALRLDGDNDEAKKSLKALPKG